MLDFLSRAASGDVVGRATGVAKRCVRAEQAAIAQSRWGGRAAVDMYQGEQSGQLAAAAAPAAVVDEGDSRTAASVSVAPMLYVEWAWRERQRAVLA